MAPSAAKASTLLFLVGAPATTEAVQCGFASSGITSCPKCFEAALNTGALAFWWNWKTEPSVDLTQLPGAVQDEVRDKFVPMLWSQNKLDSYTFLRPNGYIMGYNEPDQFGPSCFGEWNPPPYGCSLGETRPATSSGWAPLFDPSTNTNGHPHAAQFWQWTINDMTRGAKKPQNAGGVRVVSPSMAQGAETAESCIGVDPAQKGSLKFCQGWLKVFKENTLKLDCTDFDGRQTNCWDVIDSIQIHAYSRSAEEVKEKIETYYKVFQDDFDGSNGRKKKTLWLTEVAMGSNDINEILPFVDTLMNPQDGLSNKQRFFYLERVSWFSEHGFPSFHVKGYWPRKNEVWSSSLFNDFGTLSPLGQKFFGYCDKGAEASQAAYETDPYAAPYQAPDAAPYQAPYEAAPEATEVVVDAPADPNAPSWSFTIHG